MRLIFFWITFSLVLVQICKADDDDEAKLIIDVYRSDGELLRVYNWSVERRKTGYILVIIFSEV